MTVQHSNSAEKTGKVIVTTWWFSAPQDNIGSWLNWNWAENELFNSIKLFNCSIYCSTAELICSINRPNSHLIGRFKAIRGYIYVCLKIITWKQDSFIVQFQSEVSNFFYPLHSFWNILIMIAPFYYTVERALWKHTFASIKTWWFKFFSYHCICPL